MATNNEIADSLRVLAEAADDDIAQHDLTTLADALGEDETYTREDLQDMLFAAGGGNHNLPSGKGVEDYEGLRRFHIPERDTEGVGAPEGTAGARAIRSHMSYSNVNGYYDDDCREGTIDAYLATGGE